MADQVRTLSRRRVALGMGGAALGTAALGGGARAATWPDRTVTIVVPFAAGGSADVYGRVLAQKLTAMFGKTFIVEDKPGAASIIGSQYVATSRPNGDTLLVISNTHTVNETLFPHKPYKLLTNFEPIEPINSSDLVLVTRPTLPVKTLGQLIALAKKEPGKLTFASSGPGTPYHMAGELFKVMASIDIVHVPFKGSSQARIDVMSGRVDMMFDATTTMQALIASGKVKGIATTGLEQSKVLPDLPPMAKAGVPGYQAVIWLGLVAPRGTPVAIVDKINSAIETIMKDPALQKSWLAQGAVPVFMTPAQFTTFIKGDIVKWAKVIKQAKLHIHH